VLQLIICACCNDDHQLSQPMRSQFINKKDLPDYPSTKQNILAIRDSLHRIYQSSPEINKKRILGEAGN
jgi:hypothetical protein